MPLMKKNDKELLIEFHKMVNRRRKKNLDRNKMFDDMDRMATGSWELPKKAQRQDSWVHTVISSDPQDALRAATQILSSVEPKIRYQPLAPGKENTDKALAIEKNLNWQWQLLERRHRLGLLSDIVNSALTYATIAGQVIFLPHQIQAMKALKGNTARLEDALTRGKFAITLYHPSQVFAHFDTYGMQDIVYTRVLQAHEFVDFYGGMASQKMRNKLKKDYPSVLVHEYQDMKRHVIVARAITGTEVPAYTPEGSEDMGDMEVIMDAENTLGFLPWVFKERGTALYDRPEHQLRPLLYGVHTSKHWDTANIMLSVGASEILVRAASPRRRVTGPNPAAAYQVNWGEPGGIEMVDSAHIVEDVPPHQIDEGVWMTIDRLGAMLGKETVAKLIQNPEVSPEVPYSAMNLVFQLGANSLKPFQTLCEEWLGDAFRTMLRFVDKFVPPDQPLVSYAATEGEGMTRGHQSTLSGGMFDVNNLYLDVALTATVPTDQVAKANAISMMHESLRYPLARGLEEMGVTDPETAMDEWALEQAKLTDFQLAQEAKAMQQQMAIQNMGMMQQQIQQLQMQMQQMAAQGGGGQEGMFPGGQGFSGGEGGTPAAMAAPGQGREQVTGQTRTGEGTQ